MEKKPREFLFQIATLFFWFSLYAYVPNLSAYAEELGANYTIVGLITGGYGFAQMLCRIPLGIWSDRVRKRRIFVSAGFLFSLAACVLFLVFETPAMLVVARTTAGLAASTWVISTVLYSSYFDPKRSTQAMSLLNTFNHGGQLLGMLIAGLLLSLFTGYKAMFIVAAAGALIGFILSLNATEKVPENAKPMTLKGFLSVIADKRLLLLSLAALTTQVYSTSTISGFTPLLAKTLGAEAFTLSLMSILSTGLAMVGSFVSGRKFVSRMGERWFCCLCAVGLATVSVLMPHAPNLPLLYSLQGMGGFFQGCLFSLQMGLAIRHFPAEKRATAMGCYQAIYGVGMFLGPVLVGFLGDHFGLPVSYLVIACVCLVMIPLMLLWARADAKSRTLS